MSERKISVVRKIRMISFQAKVELLTLVPLGAVVTTMVIASFIFNGQKPPQWFDDLLAIAPYILCGTIAAFVVESIVFWYWNNFKKPKGYVKYSDREQRNYTREYNKKAISHQIKEMEKNGRDTSYLSEMAENPSEPDVYPVQILLESRSKRIYEFILDGRMCGYMRKVTISVDSISGQHRVCIREVGGSSIFEEDMIFEKGIRFIVKETEDGPSVTVR